MIMRDENRKEECKESWKRIAAAIERIEKLLAEKWGIKIE